MKKSVTICFRTGEEVLNVLKKISSEGRRSMSSLIEAIIYEYLAAKKELQNIKDEKRRYPRRKVSIPALVQKPDAELKKVLAGIIINLSLNGVQISVPKEYDFEVHEDSETSRVEIIFTLPESKKPLAMQCMPKTVIDLKDEVRVGATFVNSDFSSIQALQNYLLQ